jgi:hypothetical protein
VGDGGVEDVLGPLHLIISNMHTIRHSGRRTQLDLSEQAVNRHVRVHFLALKQFRQFAKTFAWTVLATDRAEKGVGVD